MSVLAFEALQKTYRTRGRQVAALVDVSLEIAGGEMVAVTGPSGCGKSTLLFAAGGMLHPTAGRVSLDGEDLYALSAGERASARAREIGFVFQLFHLVPYLDARANVALGVREGSADRERVDAVLAGSRPRRTPRASSRSAQCR